MKFKYYSERNPSKAFYINRLLLVEGVNEMSDDILNHRAFKRLLEDQIVEIIETEKTEPTKVIPQEESIEANSEPTKGNSKRSRATVKE